MANKHATLDALFADIADAIRAKTGDTNLIPAKQFPSVIRNQLDGIPSFVDFRIDGIAYRAPAGMKWGDWCVSDYNTGDLGIKYGVLIAQLNPLMKIDGVVADDVIIHGMYYLVEINTFTFYISNADVGAASEYEAVAGMSWYEWCMSEYNPGEYYVEDGYVINRNYYYAVRNNDYDLVTPSDLIRQEYEYIEDAF